MFSDLTKTCIIEIWETEVIVTFPFNLELFVILRVGVIQRRELLTKFVSESVHQVSEFTLDFCFS